MVSSPRRCRRIQSFCHLPPSLACQIFQQRRQQQSPLSSASRVLRWPCPFLHGACEVLQDPPERQEGGDVTSTALWLWYPSSLVVSFFQFVVVNSLSQCGLVVRVACRVSRVACHVSLLEGKKKNSDPSDAVCYCYCYCYRYCCCCCCCYCCCCCTHFPSSIVHCFQFQTKYAFLFAYN